MLKQALLWSIVGLLVTTIAGFAVQVDGYCYLEGQSNHAGTRVLFDADSPTAETDSAFTDATGYYQADINPGVYDVYIFHYGYSTAQFLNQLVSSAMTLPEILLMDVPDGIYISGMLSGVLEDTIYIVEGDIEVDHSDNLTIEPGARFYFLGDISTTYRFWVRGSLSAIGTETDSIKFMPILDDIGWGGIWCYSQGPNVLEYCLVTGGVEFGVRLTNFDNAEDMVVRHCTITGNSPSSNGALKISNGSATVSHCTVSENEGYGIYLSSIQDIHINNCTVVGNTSDGIYIQGYGSYDQEISYCLIYDNGGSGIYCVDRDPAITNCTVRGNAIHGVFLANCEPTIINTIVEGNNSAGINFFQDAQGASVSYSDIYDNAGGPFAGIPPDFLGIIITTNPNGDSCDAYYNIYVDPEFVDPGAGNFYLQSTSLCIDAGDPSSPLDPDGTVADMGAFYFDQLGIWGGGDNPMPSAFRLMPCYPNPFNPTTTLEFVVPVGARVNLVVYDVMGRRVATLVDGWYGAGNYKAVFDGSGMASGIYFARMQAGDFHQVQKMVLLK